MKRLIALLWLGLPVTGAWAVTTRSGVERTVCEFCQPCGDRLPRPTGIKTLRAISGDVPNSQNVDLDYPFIDSGIARPPVNLAIQALVPFCS